MSASSPIFPAAPKHVDSRTIDPSPQFRREVVKVLWAIVSFIFIYLVLVAGAILLALLCGYGGFMLIITFPKIFIIALGIGIAGVGIMVLYFLFKFVFSEHTVDRSNLIEITDKEHPRLFEFIRKVASETQTPMPKHVYLSPDVNASVFYDSGFWSMFLPVKKNLHIGLGLVNSVNLSEFKAIIAHEFGHFSQRSMKLGSYVYNVNKVIYNMLYDNDDYKETLQNWANFSNTFQIFADLTAGIVSGIQSVLKWQYTNINEGYMALSRQMEFHADSVAASVSGSQPLITSLRRIEVSGNCYNQVLSHYHTWYNKNRKAVNVFHDHTTLMLHFGTTHSLPVSEGLIQVSGDIFAGIPGCRVNIKDQWASHPPTDQREKHLNNLNIQAEYITLPAWCLFNDPEALQREVTGHLYREFKFPTEPELIEPSRFKALFMEENEQFTLDPVYKGFYDNRTIKSFELDTSRDPISENSLDEVLTAETQLLPVRIQSIQAEIETLKLVCLKSSGIENFEFKSEKYSKDEASALLQTIYRESDEAKAALAQADRRIFLLYHKLAGRQGNANEAGEAYAKLFGVSQSTDVKLSEIEYILKEVSQLFQGNVSLDTALVISRNMTGKEGPVKAGMRELLADESYKPYLTGEERTAIELFISKNWIYYIEPRLESEAIDVFVNAMNTYGIVLSKHLFDLKKKTLSRQSEVLMKGSA